MRCHALCARCTADPFPVHQSSGGCPPTDFALPMRRTDIVGAKHPKKNTLHERTQILFSEKSRLRRSNNLSTRRTRKKKANPLKKPPAPHFNDKTRMGKKTVSANGNFARHFASDEKSIRTKRRVRSSTFITDLGEGEILLRSGANLRWIFVTNISRRVLSFIGST